MDLLTIDYLNDLLRLKGYNKKMIIPLLDDVTYNQIRATFDKSTPKPKRYKEITEKIYNVLISLPDATTKNYELDTRELCYQIIQKAREITSINKERKRRIENNGFENFRIRGRC